MNKTKRIIIFTAIIILLISIVFIINIAHKEDNTKKDILESEKPIDYVTILDDLQKQIDKQASIVGELERQIDKLETEADIKENNEELKELRQKETIEYEKLKELQSKYVSILYPYKDSTLENSDEINSEE